MFKLIERFAKQLKSRQRTWVVGIFVLSKNNPQPTTTSLST
jgi:hypothetical protein